MDPSTRRLRLESRDSGPFWTRLDRGRSGRDRIWPFWPIRRSPDYMISDPSAGPQIMVYPHQMDLRTSRLGPYLDTLSGPHSRTPFGPPPDHLRTPLAHPGYPQGAGTRKCQKWIFRAETVQTHSGPIPDPQIGRFPDPRNLDPRNLGSWDYRSPIKMDPNYPILDP